MAGSIRVLLVMWLRIKTPASKCKQKYMFMGSFRSSKSSKSREELRKKKVTTLGTTLGGKFYLSQPLAKSLKIISQTKTRSDTLNSVHSSKTKIDVQN